MTAAVPTTPTNARTRQYKNKLLIEQGKVLIPTKLVIVYRFKKFIVSYVAGDPGVSGNIAPIPTISGYGIVRNNSVNGATPTAYGTPTLLNVDGNADTLFNSMASTVAETYGPEEATYKTLETAQVVYFDTENAITNFIAVLTGCEHISRVRSVILFARADEFSEEKAYALT